MASLVVPRAGTCYNDTGLFGVYVQAKLSSTQDGADLLSIVQDEIVSLSTGVSDDDLVWK